MCAQAVDGDALCDPSLTGASLDSAGKWIPRASCNYRVCVLPLPNRGAMPEGPLRAVDAGWMHSCALALDGTAYCWGHNAQGQLGNGKWAADSTGSSGEIEKVPTAVATEYRFRALSAGENTTCGISEPGAAIFCWGYGRSGQTGDSAVMHGCSGKKPFHSTTCSNAVPVRVGLEEPSTSSTVRFAQVSVGMRLACAVSVAGEAYCWGANSRCALGRCRVGNSPLAHKIALSGRAAEIGAGYWHACARTVDRRIFCWGENSGGQLGSLVSANAGADGLPPDYRDTTDSEAHRNAYDTDPCFLGGRCSPAPVEVSPGRRWSALAVGSYHSCALDDADGNVYCWGGSDSSAIGRGAKLVPCVNRSREHRDVRCQASPVRVPGLPRLVAHVLPAAPRRLAAKREPIAAHVTVSRREVRVVFPRDDGTTWGWSGLADPEYSPWYDWGIGNNGMDGPRWIRLLAGRGNDSARAFSSLDALVAAGQASLCTPGMMARCEEKNVTALVQERQVVLVLRDSAAIARLFGLRPAKVSVWASRPSEERRYPPDSVAVEYIEPRIADPDVKTLADAKASQRRYLASISSIRRSIATSDHIYSESFWVAVGDSTSVGVEELKCTYDVCTSETLSVPDSLWTLDDSTIAGLRAAAPSQDEFTSAGSSARVVGRRTGRTTLRIALSTLPSDTAPSDVPPERVLARDVVVTQPITRIELFPRVQTLRVDETIELRVRVGDAEGRWHENPPARVTVGRGAQSYIMFATSPVRVRFDKPGVQTIVAQFGALADTLTLRVAPAP